MEQDYNKVEDTLRKPTVDFHFPNSHCLQKGKDLFIQYAILEMFGGNLALLLFTKH